MHMDQNTESESLIDQLRQLAGEFDKLLKRMGSGLGQGVGALDTRVHENAWAAIGIAAAAGFLAGVLVARRK
jgi:ElaB/YqjD/DUF883 family membrane-anchored ribosome-binding protein